MVSCEEQRVRTRSFSERPAWHARLQKQCAPLGAFLHPRVDERVIAELEQNHKHPQSEQQREPRHADLISAMAAAAVGTISSTL